MKVLVTGAAGFLGRHFARHHVYLDHHVMAVDDMSSPYASWPEDLGPLVREDAALYLARSGHPRYDVAYHFAAPVGGRERIEGDPLFNADSLRLDAALFRWAASAKPKVVVYPSSSAVYGTALQQEGTAEALHEDLFRPVSPLWHAPDEMYGFTKMAGEFLAWKAAGYGVNTLCIRPFSGYGEDQSLEYPVPSIIARVRAREDPLVVWGPGTQTRDLVHVDDVVGATVARVRDGVEGYRTMNVGWGRGTSFNDLARAAAEIEGYRPEVLNLVDRPFGVMHRVCDPTRMLEHHQPSVTLEQGLRRMLGRV